MSQKVLEEIFSDDGREVSLPSDLKLLAQDLIDSVHIGDSEGVLVALKSLFEVFKDEGE